MSYETLQVLTYLLLGAAVVFYVILDGFDLGVGCLQIFAGDDNDRRVFLNSIGPFWDGNEVWLIAIVGVLLVGFPPIYAAILSGFYTLVMIMLFGIVLRAVSIEFRSKKPQQNWRYFWDTIFWASSVIITFTAGVLLGNLLVGLPIDKDGEIIISIGQIFRLYPSMVGIFSISLFSLHGCLFLLLKTEGKLQEKLHLYANKLMAVFFFLYIVITIWTWIKVRVIVQSFIVHPIFLLEPVLLVAALLLLPYFLSKKRYGWAFTFSMIAITLFFCVVLIGTFPRMLTSTIDPSYTLTLFNASAEKITLIITLVIAATGVPLVLTYGYILYRVFHGKTQLTDHSY